MIRAVTFDCWGTLISDSGFSVSMAARIDAIAAAFGIEQKQASELFDRAWREHHDEWLNGRQYGSMGIARHCMTEHGVDDDEACARLQEALEESGRLGSQHALVGAVDSLRTLRGAGFRTALVCDAGFTPGRIVRDFLNAQGLLEHLEFCAFSDEIGVPKPDPRMFQTALDALEVEAADAVHVGDLLRTDVFGARSIGMKSVRITAAGDDAKRGFSWDPRVFDAAAGDGQAAPVVASPYDDADAVIETHAELLGALRSLGMIAN